jgi:protein gp37
MVFYVFILNQRFVTDHICRLIEFIFILQLERKDGEIMTKTKIEWADRSWNPVTGCEKVSAGCAHCDAEAIARRFWKDRKFTDVMVHPERLKDPLHWRKPSRVFVDSMSDLFHDFVSDHYSSFIDEIFAVAAACPQHTFMILTKRSSIMKYYFDHPRRMMYVESALEWLYEGRIHMMPELMWPLPNVWLGVSVEDQKTAEQRIPDLLATPAKVRFLSCEPLLGPLDLWKFATREETFGSMYDHRGSYGFYPGLPKEPVKYHEGIDWVIAGGESGPNARPMHPDWVRSIRDQCVDAGVPFFFKQWGEWVPAVFRMEYPTSKSFVFKDGALVMRAGKKKAGRVLDGREWNEFPMSESAVNE